MTDRWSPSFRERLTKTRLPLETVLYHGTSKRRLRHICETGHLRLAQTGAPKISFTTERKVAIYWANLAVDTDADEALKAGEVQGVCDNPGMVLCVRYGDLVKQGFHLTHHSDSAWGAGECDDEHEIACWNTIPLKWLPRRSMLSAITLENYMDGPIVLTGYLNWSRGENICGRMGSVIITKDEAGTMDSAGLMESSLIELIGTRVSFAAIIRDRRKGIYNHLAPPTGYPGCEDAVIVPPINTRVELGTGIFQLEDTGYGPTAYVLHPGTDRQDDWMPPLELYKLHQQLVDFYITPV